MELFNASLGVPTVPAHVPLAHGAVRTRNGIGPADDTYHQIALFQSAARPGLEHATKRFMAQYEARLSWRSPAVLALSGLQICPADPNRYRFHEHRPASEIRLRNIFEFCRARFLRFYRDRFHCLFITPLCGRFAPLLQLQSRKAQTQIFSATL